MCNHLVSDISPALTRSHSNATSASSSSATATELFLDHSGSGTDSGEEASWSSSSTEISLEHPDPTRPSPSMQIRLYSLQSNDERFSNALGPNPSVIASATLNHETPESPSSSSNHRTSSSLLGLWSSLLHRPDFKQWVDQVPTPTSSVIGRRFSALAEFGIGEAAAEVAPALPHAGPKIPHLTLPLSSPREHYQSPISSDLNRSPIHESSSMSLSFVQSLTGHTLAEPNRLNELQVLPSSPHQLKKSPLPYSARFRPRDWNEEQVHGFGELVLISRSTISSSPPQRCDQVAEDSKRCIFGIVPQLRALGDKKSAKPVQPQTEEKNQKFHTSFAKHVRTLSDSKISRFPPPPLKLLPLPARVSPRVSPSSKPLSSSFLLGEKDRNSDRGPSEEKVLSDHETEKEIKANLEVYNLRVPTWLDKDPYPTGEPPSLPNLDSSLSVPTQVQFTSPTAAASKFTAHHHKRVSLNRHELIQSSTQHSKFNDDPTTASSAGPQVAPPAAAPIVRRISLERHQQPNKSGSQKKTKNTRDDHHSRNLGSGEAYEATSSITSPILKKLSLNRHQPITTSNCCKPKVTLTVAPDLSSSGRAQQPELSSMRSSATSRKDSLSMSAESPLPSADKELTSPDTDTTETPPFLKNIGKISRSRSQQHTTKGSSELIAKPKRKSILRILRAAVQSPTPTSATTYSDVAPESSGPLSRPGVRRSRSHGCSAADSPKGRTLLEASMASSLPLSALFSIEDDNEFLEALGRRTTRCGRSLPYLLVLRELVWSERSYAKHLNSLLDAVKRVSTLERASFSMGITSSSTGGILAENLLTQLPTLIKLSEKITDQICLGLEDVERVFLSLEDELRLTFGKWVKTMLPGVTGLGQGGVFGNAGGLKGSRLGWSDVLIMPIQRVTRYPLFLSELVKVSGDRDDNEVLKLALFRSRALAEYCNQTTTICK